MKNKTRAFTKAEKGWILYDWANSVYATNIMAAIFPIYFTSVCAGSGASGDVWWGYGTSAATLIMALLAPTLGAFGDYKGMKKKLFSAFLIIGVLFTLSMALFDNWQMMLVGYVLSHIGFLGSCLFYDSFLTDITTPERMDRVSSWGFAMGYIGGSTIPFVLSIAVIMMADTIGITDAAAVKFSVVLTAVWWSVFSIPMLRRVSQKHFIEKRPGNLAAQSFQNLWRTMKDIFRNKRIFIFALAYFFYIDGVNTIISLATAYGSTLGLDSTGMILALLVTQLVAVPFSLMFSRFAEKIGAIKMISAAIGIYCLICVVGFFMGSSIEPHQQAFSDAVDSKMVVYNVKSTDGFQRTELYRELISDVKTNILPREERDQALVNMVAGYTARYEATGVSPSQAQAELGKMIPALLEVVTDRSLTDPFEAARQLSTLLFWAMAVLVGTVQGGIQALSRSFFGKLVPPAKSSEYFGFFDIFGKFAAVVGPLLYSSLVILTGRSSIGILSVAFLFMAGGLVLFLGRRRLRTEGESQ